MTKEQLQAARDALVERGWRRGGFIDHEGRVCAVGAYLASRPDHKLDPYGAYGFNPRWVQRSNVVRAINEYVRALGFQHSGQAFAWNDRESTTLEHVLNRLDMAIAVAGKE